MPYEYVPLEYIKHDNKHVLNIVISSKCIQHESQMLVIEIWLCLLRVD